MRKLADKNIANRHKLLQTKQIIQILTSPYKTQSLRQKGLPEYQ